MNSVGFSHLSAKNSFRPASSRRTTRALGSDDSNRPTVSSSSQMPTADAVFSRIFQFAPTLGYATLYPLLDTYWEVKKKAARVKKIAKIQKWQGTMMLAICSASKIPVPPPPDISSED